MKRALALTAMGLALSFGACSSMNSGESQANGMKSDAAAAPTQSPDKRMEMAAGLSSQDKNFMGAASAGGHYEVEAGQLALQKTQDAHVRMIAQHMVQDHTKANEQLAMIAHQKGVVPSSAPDLDQQKMLNELKGLNGTDFDQRYLQQQKQAHEQTIAIFQKEANEGGDNQVRQFAAQTLPTLQEHLRMINGDNNNMSSDQH